MAKKKVIPEAQAKTLRKYRIVLLPGEPAVIDPETMERNRLLTQRGYRQGRCWECERTGETQEIALVKRKGINGYVYPKHGGDDGKLEPLPPVVPVAVDESASWSLMDKPCGREGCGHPRHSHRGGTGYCQRGVRCGCEGFVDPEATTDYRVPVSPEVQAIKLRDTRQREAQLLRPIDGLTPPPNAQERAWLKRQKREER